ncbi:ribonuclease E/G [Novosphingobium sp. KCTC 2891]|uniref:ribonuclease E/G n=1 Tax=Novosphingobium sp. KCTC 2891 TaxID=2989730 RepID=UPI002221970C|nr:ribonuclease E/G [Novosphingobium sp. KCTC 2891]MCW1381196.1 ribonuclease E/G [Novosphingobium sp. KCTC 2891]
MPEWLHEAGIGEERAILVEGGTILAARIDWGEPLRPGLVARARIVRRLAGTRRGMARFADGTTAQVDSLPPEATEGRDLLLRVTRASIAERGRTKLAQARPAGADEAPRPAPTLLHTLADEDHPVRAMPATDRRFDEAGWHELVEEAMSGEIAFPGGSLTISPTPAMTLIDIDGSPPLPGLALAAVPAIAAALPRLDIGGSIGIDFPTLSERKDRQAVDAALTSALAGWRGERTAMNGYGFVQLVARLERPSLVARFARDPVGAAARILLRQAERVSEPGVLLLTAHPAVLRAVSPAWETELARRTGRAIRRHEQPGLALAAGFAQAVPA